MKKDTPDRPGKSDSGQDSGLDIVHSLARSAALMELLYEQSQAGRWGLSRDRFAGVLQRSAKKLSAAGAVTAQKLEEYLAALHLEDLALACACAEGYEAAWEHFFSGYRPYLRAAAAAILRCNADSPEACDLADSLFSDLYGLVDTKGPERSLFRYFHGRSSLKTWLRAVLAQRHIDAIRASRRFAELGDEDAPGGQPRMVPGPSVQPPDPHRQRYLALFSGALEATLERLEPSELERLRLYYNEEKTLAEIGRLLGEHESSVSRHLDQVRRDLRTQVEENLRRGFMAANGSAAQPGLSDAEITLCFEYSAEDMPIDLEKLLPRPKPQGPLSGKQPA
ncbi:MAG TPA: sigma-70 family RNA polymerase sigma factor [Candidatus Acidoferrum sp.]|jgi:RNA polymerase sigma-70 factor|nr:sigma-70 family RNA polymerase sigma factor [Candidatus Acidoferrum sp.]